MVLVRSQALSSSKARTHNLLTLLPLRLVVVVAKFRDQDDLIKMANDTMYGLAAAVFSKDINRAISTAHRMQAGTVWVNCANQLHANVPFGGFKQSGIGRELGEYALHK